MRLLETALAFWRGVRNQLSFTRDSPAQLFSAVLRRTPAFETLGFVTRTLGRTEPFPTAYAQALAGERGRWQGEELTLLGEMGALLGSTTLPEQLEGLDHATARLELLLEEARERRRRQGGLYRSLGLTGGAAVLVLLL